MRRLAWSLLHVALALLTVRVGAAPPQWLPARDISLGSRAGRVSDMDLCARGSEVVVVWSDARLGDRRLFWRRSPDFGATWEPEALVTSAAPMSTQPTITCDEDHLYLAWIRGDGAAAELRFSRFDGVGWTTAVSVASDVPAASPDIAVTHAFPRAVGIAYERTGTTTQAVLAFSADDGDTWTNPEPVARAAGVADASARPAITGAGELFYLAWQDFREATPHIYFTTRGPALVGSERRLSQVGGSGAPSLSARGRRVIAAWESKPGLDGPDIYASVSENEGFGWEVPTALTSSAPQSAQPTTLILDDAAYVAWQDGSHGAFEAFLARRDARVGWGVPTRFTESPLASIRARLAVNFPDAGAARDAAAQVQLAWLERDGDGSAAVAHSARDTLPPKTPVAPYHVDISAQTGWDDDAQTLFRWEEDPMAAVYRVFLARDGGPAEEILVTDVAEARIDGVTDTVSVSVVAEDAVGNRSGVSGPSEAIRIDAGPPVVAVEDPRDGAVIFATSPVRVSCRDDNLASCIVEFGPSPEPSVWTPLTEVFTESFELSQVASIPAASLDGIYTLRVRAEDHAGSRTTAVVRFVVDAAAPLIVGAGLGSPLLPSNDLATGRRDAAWSPVDDTIAFVSDEGGAQDVWIARSDGSDARAITRDAFVDATPTWSPDGSALAFASHRNGAWDIYVTTLAGEITPLRLSDAGNALDPAWAPDGLDLAFASDRDGDFELYVLGNLSGVLGGEPPVIAQVTRNGVDDRGPSWGPGGAGIAYQSARGATWDVRHVQLTTGDDRQLTASFDTDIAADYHSDGKRILFTRIRSDGSAGLHAYDLVRASTHPLSAPGGDARFGVWSRSGRSVLFERERDLVLAPLTFPELRLEAHITEPPNGAFLAATTDVAGVARGSDMAHYRLEFAEANDGDAWAPITGDVTAPVPDTGFLGRWDTRGLQGEYRLRLTVSDAAGGADVSETRVRVRDVGPQLQVRAPGNGDETVSSEITVAGTATAGADLTLNGERLPTDSGGRFDFRHAISPGVNDLQFRVSDLSGEEVTVTRRVTRVTEPFAIDIASPTPFEALTAPYVEVSGVASGAVWVQVEGGEVPVDADGRFSRALAVGEERRVIRVVARDRLGREALAERLALYAPGQAAGRADTSPPALVEPDPPVGAVLATGRFSFRARIVDDRGFDPDTLVLSFGDDEGQQRELPEEDWQFDEATGELTYDPNLQLADGEHFLTVTGADLVGNPLIFGALSVTVDTRPSVLALSATLGDPEGSDLRVVLTSNRPLASVLSAQARAPNQLVGFPLALELASGEDNTDSESGGDGSGLFTYATPLLLGPAGQVALAASVRGMDRGVRTVLGGFAVAALSARSTITLTLSDGVAAAFAPTETASAQRIVFRTQDGLDVLRTVAQRRDISERELALDDAGAAIYVVEPADPDVTAPALRLTAPLTSPDHRAWFLWDEARRRWAAIPGQFVDLGVLTADVAGGGAFALIADRAAPILVSVDPPSRGELRPDRYLVEAHFLDVGSGVSQADVTATLDGMPVPVEVAADENRASVRYVPTDLPAGLHTLRLSVADRAGNVAVESFDYLTSEVFRYTSFRLAPNPARKDSARAVFRLTQTADVRMDIYTADGRLVRSEELRDVVGDGFDASQTRESFTWDLTNSAGRPVASGVYIVQLTATNVTGEAIRVTDKWAVIR
ncbi:hypothetical protein HN371_22050 [Candidatus Poribacteria bacterium]|nr:hypothetical protein [Candidatus Poribacteria bacterium]MBT5715058.1 hypothetical protein [Candidatus Poribacteria bacterium]MBT7803895.1 hypothetical protein [Candidatus Poribacteria bacterium]